ncbi:MAG TPA: copper homeostasis protein CutC [Gemmatimonadaceae bacterium]|nr:copper homeostasis protein CutC [Gemmatimonadaceae bacterium]
MNHPLTLVEAAVESLEAALAAERAGADRLELCVNLDDGGTTPSTRLTAAIIDATKLPVFVLIRPRAGDFVYSDEEIDLMIREVETAGIIGVAGIVTGALRSDHTVDIVQTRALVEAAAGLPVTFHRAFDSTIDTSDALEQLIDLGVTRVLTSGGASTALEGADIIAALVDQARDRITVVAGGGIREHNVSDVIRRTGVREIHTRFVGEARMKDFTEIAKRT